MGLLIGQLATMYSQEYVLCGQLVLLDTLLLNLAQEAMTSLQMQLAISGQE